MQAQRDTSIINILNKFPAEHIPWEIQSVELVASLTVRVIVITVSMVEVMVADVVVVDVKVLAVVMTALEFPVSAP